MLEFLNEVLLIEDLEPDAYQMGISGKSGAKMKAPDGGKASMKGDFNALHPRYPKGHPQGGKFMPKGSKDQINAVAKVKGVSTEQAAAMVGAKAPANKGKLKKFSGSAGAVGKAQKVLKDKNATPEQRAKAKASINKAAMKMRGEISTESEPKRSRISNKELMARNASDSVSVPTRSTTQGDSRKMGSPMSSSASSTGASSAIVLSGKTKSGSSSGSSPVKKPVGGWFGGTLASKTKIKRRLKELAKKYHPDRGGSKELMQDINQEYEKALGKVGTRKNKNVLSGRTRVKAQSSNNMIVRKAVNTAAKARERKRFNDMFSSDNEIKF